MRRSRRLFLVLFLAVIVFSLVPSAVGLAEDASHNDFLAELATIQPVPGFSAAFFTSVNRPGRYEIALFLYKFDLELSQIAERTGSDLSGTFLSLRRQTKPSEETPQAESWARGATRMYRQVLLEYYNEMSFIGYDLGSSGFPVWTKENQNAFGR